MHLVLHTHTHARICTHTHKPSSFLGNTHEDTELLVKVNTLGKTTNCVGKDILVKILEHGG